MGKKGITKISLAVLLLCFSFMSGTARAEFSVNIFVQVVGGQYQAAEGESLPEELNFLVTADLLEDGDPAENLVDFWEFEPDPSSNEFTPVLDQLDTQNDIATIDTGTNFATLPTLLSFEKESFAVPQFVSMDVTINYESDGGEFSPQEYNVLDYDSILSTGTLRFTLLSGEITNEFENVSFSLESNDGDDGRPDIEIEVFGGVPEIPAGATALVLGILGMGAYVLRRKFSKS